MALTHGTPRGYEQHLKAGEEPCDGCFDAYRNFYLGCLNVTPAVNSRAFTGLDAIDGPFIEYAARGVDGVVRPVSAETAQIEATRGAEIYTRSVTPWRRINIPVATGGLR